MPLPQQPYFERWNKNDTPVADKVWKDMVTLPLHARLTDEEVDYVLDALHAYEEENQPENNQNSKSKATI